MSPTKNYKRKNYFIDKGFQKNFILKFCALVALGGLLTIGLLYLWAGRATTVSIVNSQIKVTSVSDFILPILIQTVIIVLLLVSFAAVALALFISHKIAGPLYRFKTSIEKLEKGDLSADFSIRKNDQLQSVANAFNDTIKKIREVINNLQQDAGQLKKSLENIQDTDITEQKRPALRELKKLSENLNKQADFFKV